MINERFSREFSFDALVTVLFLVDIYSSISYLLFIQLFFMKINYLSYGKYTFYNKCAIYILTSYIINYILSFYSNKIFLSLLYIEHLSYNVSIGISYNISVFVSISVYHIIDFLKLLAIFDND